MRSLGLVAGALCTVALMSGFATAKKREPLPPMPTGYDDPGPAPQSPLPAIVEKLRQRLTDPASMRDVTLCPARSVPVYSVGSTWVPAGWIVQITLNSKNRFGGYTGSMEYTAYIKDGVVSEVSETPPIEMIVAVARPSYLQSAAGCPRIANAEIQKLVDG
jgi:hypothetical protein